MLHLTSSYNYLFTCIRIQCTYCTLCVICLSNHGPSCLFNVSGIKIDLIGGLWTTTGVVINKTISGQCPPTISTRRVASSEGGRIEAPNGV